MEVEAVWSNSLASMKGPSRRRGNGSGAYRVRRRIHRLNEGPLQKEGQFVETESDADIPGVAASMKGPSRRRGNCVPWTCGVHMCVWPQ